MKEGLYAITPNNLKQDELLEKIEVILNFGVKLIQYRDKELVKNEFEIKAAAIKDLTEKYKAKLIINDYLDVCLEINADGFHLGIEDYNLKKTKEMMQKNKDFINQKLITGLSCSANKRLIESPPEDIISWTYLAVGSFFKTNTKKGKALIETKDRERFLKMTKKPLVAIGGIRQENIGELKKLGYKTFAVSESVFEQNPGTFLEKHS